MLCRSAVAWVMACSAFASACASESGTTFEPQTASNVQASEAPGEAPANSTASSTDLFTYEIADAALQLSDKHNALQYQSENYVAQVHDCKSQFSTTLNSWLGQHHLQIHSESEPEGEGNGRVVVVDVVTPSEGFLFIAYRRFEEGRRASLRIRFDSSKDLEPKDRNALIEALQLNGLREGLITAMKCS